MPFTRTIVTMVTISTAGRLMTPAAWTKSTALYTIGGQASALGKCSPNFAMTLWKYPDQPFATVAAPSAYSRIKSQPMIQAKSSPSVAYAYVYAEPATGAIDANSA